MKYLATAFIWFGILVSQVINFVFDEPWLALAFSIVWGVAFLLGYVTGGEEVIRRRRERLRSRRDL